MHLLLLLPSLSKSAVVSSPWPSCLLPSQLNSGATAIVYEARDLHSGLGVALKVLYRAIPDSHALQLLRREANAESLDHPGIVKMLKVFRHGQEKLWCIVSELVDGQDLLDTLNSYPESQLPQELGQWERREEEKVASTLCFRLID